ncbi:MAG: ketol-acid reductoisomerase [Candidatus Peribacteraceae bacterium]|nr:ketol-acid reductoisomerase [Candidatus Peribacteraceae bacterium]
MKLLYDKDANVNILKGKVVAVIGYGAQGRAQARMMHESGLNVIVGVRPKGPSWKLVKQDGLKVASISEAAAKGDIVHILIPDEHQKTVYASEIRKQMKAGKILSFSHGFNIVFKRIKPPMDVGVIMVAPKCPGTEEYKCYKQGFGVPALIAIHQESKAKDAKAIALAMAKAMRFTKAGVLQCTFAQETYEDLFGEQAVLCGGLAELIKTGFEVLTEAGYPPELAYFECLHEMKLIVDLVYEGGIGHMWHVVSNTAEYGGRTRGKRIINAAAKKEMKKILKEVENGTFARQWMKEAEKGKLKNLEKMRKAEQKHSIEVIGKKIRAMFDEGKK